MMWSSYRDGVVHNIVSDERLQGVKNKDCMKALLQKIRKRAVALNTRVQI